MCGVPSFGFSCFVVGIVNTTEMIDSVSSLIELHLCHYVRRIISSSFLLIRMQPSRPSENQCHGWPKYTERISSILWQTENVYLNLFLIFSRFLCHIFHIQRRSCVFVLSSLYFVFMNRNTTAFLILKAISRLDSAIPLKAMPKEVWLKSGKVK